MAEARSCACSCRLLSPPTVLLTKGNTHLSLMQEATQAIKKVLGDYYKSDSRPLLSALWTDLRLCRYVAPDAPGSGIFWFRK